MRTWPVLLLTLTPLLSYAAEQAMPIDNAATQSARFYRSPEERRDAGQGTKITDWLVFSGLVEIEKEYLQNHFQGNITSSEDDGLTPTVEAVFEVSVFPWLVGEFVFEAEYDNGYFARTDEGLLAIETERWGLKIGRQYLPFGEFYSHFVSGPLAEFGETRATSLIADYSFNDNIEVSAFVFDGDFARPDDGADYDWGLALEYVSSTEAIRLGVSYLSDLAEAEERLLEEHVYNYQRRASAWSAYALIGFDQFELTAEIVQAQRSLLASTAAGIAGAADNEEDETDDEEQTEALKPSAYNFELAYFPQPHLQFAVRVEHSKELDEAPEWRYGVSISWRIGAYIGFALDYLYDEYQRGFVLDDDDNELHHGHRVAAQLVMEF